MSDEGRLYNISEVARELKITRDTVSDWIKKGIIESVPHKKRQLITQETLDYLRAHITPEDKRANQTGSYLLNR